MRNHLVFFADSEVPCPACQGRRFQDHVLAIRFQGLSISDMLDLSVDEALSLFEASTPESSAPACAFTRSVLRILRLLADVGLDYLTLGQSLTTLSEGECQRLKLARELLKAPSGRSLYLLDEPTRGLHPKDVAHFLILLDRLVDAGNTVIVVEHNQQLIRACDYVLDLGPEGGQQGGEAVFSGTPGELLERGTGATADCLREAEETETAFLSLPAPQL